MPSGSIYDNLTAAFDPYRLVLRGGIHLKMDKSQTPQTLMLVGYIGRPGMDTNQKY